MRKKMTLLMIMLLVVSQTNIGVAFMEAAPGPLNDTIQTPEVVEEIGTDILEGIENKSAEPTGEAEIPPEVQTPIPVDPEPVPVDPQPVPVDPEPIPVNPEPSEDVPAVESPDPEAAVPEPVILEELSIPVEEDASVEVETPDIDLDDPALQDKYFVVVYSDGTVKTMQVEAPPVVRGLSLDAEAADEVPDIESQIKLYEEKDNVALVEPLVVRRTTDIEAAYIPDDPYYLDNSQWGLKALRADLLYGWNYTNPLSGVTLAILDTGMDMDHPDLAGSLASVDRGDGVMVHGYDVVNNDYDPSDGDGHGTHVAGIAAAIVNNGIGVAGVAGGVKILPVKVMNDAGHGTQTDVVKGINWAVSHGADIISMSLGSNDFSAAEQAAIDAAYAKGIIVVAAAGNDSNNWSEGLADIPLPNFPKGAAVKHNPVYYPAACNHVIGVAALGRHEGQIALADFSNSGEGIDIAAAGEEVFSTLSQYDSEAGGESYGLMSGTSMATPHVAGLAALLLSEYPAYGPDQIEAVIKGTADWSALSGDTTYGRNPVYYGSGMADAYAAVGGDVRLRDLLSDAGTWTFDPWTSAQSITVASSVATIGLKPVKNNSGQQVLINEVPYSGSGYFPVSLQSGANTITVKVTAKDLVTTGTYVLTVTRTPAEDATLHGLAISAGTLSPAFSPAVTAYTAQVANTVTDMTITPSAAEKAVVKINGVLCASGKPCGVTLKTGGNPFNLEVKASDGGVQNYSLTVTRAGAVIPPPPPATGGGGGGGGGGGSGGAETVVKVNSETELNLNALTITFAANSSNSEFQASLGTVSYSNSPFEKNQRLIDKVYAVSSNSDVELEKAMSLSFTWQSKDINPDQEQPAIFYLNEKTNKWLELTGTSVDAKKRTIAGTSKLFTEYALLAIAKEVPVPEVVAIPVAEVPAAPPTVFADLTGHWAADRVYALIEKKAISGYPDGSFRPDAPITRSEFVAVLTKAQGMTGTKEIAFPDMESHWAKDSVRIGYANGFVTGYPDGLFHPNDPITREQMAVMVDRTLRYAAQPSPVNPADQGDISPWAADAVRRMMAFKVISGYPDNTFRPQALATRAEAAAVILKTITD